MTIGLTSDVLLRFRVARCAYALLFVMATGCGSDSGGDHTRATDRDSVKDAGTEGGSGGGGATADGGGNKLWDLAPQCEEGFLAALRITGTMDGFEIDHRDTPASSLGPGGVGTIDGAKDGLAITFFRLNWQPESLPPGIERQVYAGTLALPSESTGGAGEYCVLSGEVASAPDELAPTTGERLYFHVTQVGTLNGRDCTEPKPADVRGCFYRTTDGLP